MSVETSTELTLADASDLCKIFLNESGAFWKAADILALGNMANRMVWREIARMDPSHIDEYNRVTYPAGADTIDLSSDSFLGDVASLSSSAKTGPMRIISVGQLESNSDPDQTNQQTLIDYRNPGESPTQSADVSSNWRTDRIFWSLNEGYKLTMNPIPSSDMYLWIRWVRFPKKMTATSEKLLDGGRAVEYHDLLVGVLGKLMQYKERAVSPSISELHAFIVDHIRQGNASRGPDNVVRYENPYT